MGTKPACPAPLARRPCWLSDTPDELDPSSFRAVRGPVFRPRAIVVAPPLGGPNGLVPAPGRRGARVSLIAHGVSLRMNASLRQL